ncbi:MAG: metallophosphoesterase [Verrucomicrobiae bacterium]|nr:metallophosphoesterase [Verrucomicrobiae bacterium]
MFPRVLAVSDLHADRTWFAWTIRHATRFDLICIGGDVCDVFAREDPDQQRAAVKRWLVRLVASGVPVALAEGNHDDRPHRWLEGAAGLDSLLLAGFSGTVCAGGSQMLLTICPDTSVEGIAADRVVEGLLSEAAAKRAREPMPWMVLHHEPPDGTPICCGAEGNRSLADAVTRHQPDLVVTAHIHESPFRKDRGGRWHAWIGSTLLVNSGQMPDRPWPCHFRIADNDITWRALGQPRETVPIR